MTDQDYPDWDDLTETEQERERVLGDQSRYFADFTGHTFTLTTEPRSASALYMRMSMATATASDGTEIELDITASGNTLLLTVTRPDGEKIRENLSLASLVTAWANAIGGAGG